MIPVTYGTHLHRRNQKPNRTALRFGFLSARFVGIVLLALLALLYIAQTSQGANKRVEVHALQSQADSLETEQQQLQLEALRSQSLNEYEQAIPNLGLTPVDSVEHSK